MNAQANFPSDLDIFPSSHSASDTSNGLIETEDIEGFGIAGRLVPLISPLFSPIVPSPDERKLWILRTWEASYLILPYLLPPTPSSQFDYSPPPPTHDLHSPSSSTILEIGSGTGFLSLSLASYLIRGTTSTSKMIMTDLTEVCPLLLRNLHHSILSPSSQILIRPLPWGSSQAIQELEREGLKPTFIIASDLVYFPFLFPSLLRTLISLTEGKDRVGVVFGYKIRSLVKEEPFWKALGTSLRFPPLPRSFDIDLGSENRELV